jgi:hypothetical protein
MNVLFHFLYFRKSQGILSEKIYLLGARLVMILQTRDKSFFRGKDRGRSCESKNSGLGSVDVQVSEATQAGAARRQAWQENRERELDA